MPAVHSLELTEGKGSNSVQVRRYNERIVFRELRRCGKASKAELARRSNLTNAAVGVIMDGLEADGLIRIKGKEHVGVRGQPPTLYEMRSDGAYGIGVRIDRSFLETVLMDISGRTVSRRFHDLPLPEPNKALDMVSSDISELISAEFPSTVDQSANSLNGRMTGIGLAQPYHLGGWLRELDLPAKTFLQWEEFDFRRALETRTGLPVYSENDGTAAAIAEMSYGTVPDRESFLYVFFGPAIGGGVVLNGTPLSGTFQNAGDVGPIPVPPSRLASAPKPKGDWDLLLTRASLNSLIRHLAYYGEKSQTRESIESSIVSGHRAVGEWVSDCVDALVPVVHSALAILDVPLLVIDSDVNGGLKDTLRDELERELAVRAPEGRKPPSVQIGAFGSDAGAIGAATLPLFLNFSPQTSILSKGESQPVETRTRVN